MRVKNNLIDTFLNKNKEMDKTNKIVKSKMIHEFEIYRRLAHYCPFKQALTFA